VTDDARERDRAPSRLDVLDGQAGPAGDDARHRLARPRRGIGQLDRLERKVRASQQHCFHAALILSATGDRWCGRASNAIAAARASILHS
jgi:hypothetical protein